MVQILNLMLLLKLYKNDSSFFVKICRKYSEFSELIFRYYFPIYLYRYNRLDKVLSQVIKIGLSIGVIGF
jgi:hypothetical protein